MSDVAKIAAGERGWWVVLVLVSNGASIGGSRGFALAACGVGFLGWLLFSAHLLSEQSND